MRNKSCASWDRGYSTWGGRGGCVGIVSVLVVKWIFRYLKGQPKLGLWYPRDSPFNMEAFSDSDYAGASHDRKSTTGGCQFLGKRLISWFSKAVWLDMFWQTATTRTFYNGEMEITATIDGKVKVVTKASVKRHLKLEDSYGSTVPVKSHHTSIGAPSTSQPHLSSTPRNSIRHETEVPKPSSPTHIYVADKAASAGVDVKHRGAATTVTSFDAGKGNCNIDKTLSIPHDSPLLKGRYEQDMEFDFDAVKKDSTDEQVSTAGAAVATASVDISPASLTRRVSTVEDITMAMTLVCIRKSAAKTKDKGKGIMEESESDMTKIKRQQEQERLGLETVVRLQQQFDEEERQRMARVHKVA
nr:uncharacterized mitochondrial protein AtMg00810-like [Tanacetum cinerariifolium]